MLVGLWRTVVSLLGGFPALRDAAGTKGESWVVLAGCGGLLRAYRNWQLIALSLYIALRTCIFSFFAYSAFGDLSFAPPGLLRRLDTRILG